MIGIWHIQLKHFEEIFTAYLLKDNFHEKLKGYTGRKYLLFVGFGRVKAIEDLFLYFIDKWQARMERDTSSTKKDGLIRPDLFNDSIQ